MSEQAPVPQTVDTDPISQPRPEDELSLVIVDQTQDARDFARDAADKRLTEELNEGGRVKRFIKGIWKGNIARDYYRQSYIQEAQKSIADNQDVLTHTSTPAERRADAIATTIDRFRADNDDLIHEAAGEKRNELEGDSDIAQGLKSIIRRYANGNLDDATLSEEGKRAIKAYGEANGTEKFGEGLVQISNILEIAKAVKGKVEHGESLDNVVNGMKIVAGEARTGARSEAKYDRVDKVIDKIEKSKLRFIPKGAVVAGVTIASSLARIGSTKAVNAAFMTVLPGLGAGFIAGIRERKRVKDERIQHSREMASGGQEIRDNSKRREQMEKTRYKTERAVDLSASLLAHHEAIYLDDSEREAGDTKDGALQAALDALAAVQARNDMSDSKNIDLISYTDVASIGDERIQLDLARAQVKVALGQELDDATRTRLGLETGTSLNELIASRADAFVDINEDISTKDQAFRKLRWRRALKVGAATGATAIIGGVIAQEAIASLSDTRTGFVEQAWGAQNVPVDGVDHQTVLHGLINGDQGTSTIDHHAASGDYTANTLADHSSLSVSNETNFVNNGNGTFNLVGPTGEITAENVPINPDGSMPQSSIDLLRSHGMTVEDSSYTIDLVGSETKTGGLAEYMEQYKGDTTHVTRDLWYDNDTTEYDKNELGLWRGGTNNNGINPDGGIQFTTSPMTEDGSYNGDQSAHWKELAESGQLKVAISASVETQTQVFMVDIAPDGTINIPPDSPASAFFQEHDVEVPLRGEDGKYLLDDNGNVVTEMQKQVDFTGQYMEVAQMTGADAEGVEHIRPLATLVGNSEAANMVTTQEIPTHTPEPHFEYKITGAGYDTTTETSAFTEMAPVTPIASRRAMETLKPIETTPDGGDYGYNYYYGDRRLSAEQERRRRAETSPRLNRNPEARLDQRQELDWYREQLRTHQGDAYVEEIDNIISNNPELQNLPEDIRAIVTIPVGATAESENIYKTLASYANQDPAALAKTKILLHVNWIDSAQNDPAKLAKIRKTLSEIDRARRDFPDLPLATMQSIWEQEKLDADTGYAAGEYGRGLIGHVTRRMYDVAMNSVLNGMQNGTIKSDQDVMLIRNDADAQGINRHYLTNMVDNLDEHPENDVFTGAIRWDTARHSDLPGFAFVTNFREIMHISTRRKGIDAWPPTVGINTGVRMSTLAAVGGVGYDPVETGAGSDDLAIGGRINLARRGGQHNLSYNQTRRARLFGRLTGRGNQNLSTYEGSDSRGAHAYHRHVAGAAIDTKGDRLEGVYMKGRSIVDAWGDFDKGGHKDRRDGLSSTSNESLKSQPKEIIERIETNLSGMMTQWFHDRAHISAGLAMMLPADINGKPVYQLTQGAGGASFKFTPEGATWVINHLARDSKGRFDPIGRRVRRQQYNEATGYKKQPLAAQSQLV